MANQTIVIVEQNWGGHHPMYHAQFVVAAAEAGYYVLALSPFPEESKALVIQYAGTDSNIHFEKSSFDLAKIPIARKIPALYNQKLFSTVKQDVEQSGASEIKEVLFCCLFHGAYPSWRSLEKDFPYSWSALAIESNIFKRDRGFRELVRDRSFRPYRIYNARNCNAVLSLEYEKLEKIRNTVQCKVEYVPEIIDTERWSQKNLESKHPKLSQINVPLVGVMGGLGPRKSLYELVVAASSIEHRNWGILAAGSFTEHVGYSADQYKKIIEFFENDPQSYCYFKRASDEEYNALVDRSSIAFLCYQNFTRSSNNLAKAAWAKKPSIVLPSGSLAQRVRKYQMGEVIPDLKAQTISEAISKLLEIAEGFEAANYLEDHCQTRAISIKEFLISTN